MPLVVDPVMVASSGATLLEDDAVEALVSRLFPLATVITPNLPEAVALAGREGSRRELAERLHELGAPAVIVTGGHGRDAVDHLFDGVDHVEIPVERHASQRRTARAARTRRRSRRCSPAACRSRRRRAARRARRPRQCGTGSPSSAPAKVRSTSST